MAAIYRPMEIMHRSIDGGEFNIHTGRYRMVMFSDEGSPRLYHPLCDCVEGHKDKEEATYCADARIRLPDGMRDELWCACPTCGQKARKAPIGDY